MSDRDISAIVEDIYGFSLSHDTISRIVERIQPRSAQWQSRELELIYAFVYVEAMVVKAKQDGKARNKAVYSVLGIDMTGHKDVLGLWISENEGVHFWMMIFDELKARGVEQMLFVCIDGLSEQASGIRAIYPQAHVQRCMVHLVRGSLKYIPPSIIRISAGIPRRYMARFRLQQPRKRWRTSVGTGRDTPPPCALGESEYSCV